MKSVRAIEFEYSCRLLKYEDRSNCNVSVIIFNNEKPISIFDILETIKKDHIKGIEIVQEIYELFNEPEYPISKIKDFDFNNFPENLDTTWEMFKVYNVWIWMSENL